MRHPLLGAVLSVAFAFSAVACGPVPPPPPHAANEAPLPPIIEVSDDAFAASLHRVLRDGSSAPERQGTLAGVVRRQLAHAAKRFSLGADGRGTSSTIGALYLLRVGEGRGDIIDPIAADALKGAMTTFGPRGDEGRAFVLLTMRAAALPKGSPERAEVEEHIAQLERWVSETRHGGPAQLLGADERAKLSRALIDPTDAAVSDAALSIGAWLAQAAKYESIFKSTGERPDRDELPETFRALRTAGSSLAGLHLRYGDAKGALESIERLGARRYISPLLYDRLRRAARSDAAADWQELASVLTRAGAPASEEDEEDETLIQAEPDIAQASLWGATLEAYRRDPTHFRTAEQLSRLLIGLGLSEAVPLVLQGAVGARPPRSVAAASLEMLRRALKPDFEAVDIDACRRTFRAAGPLLALLDSPDLRGVEPSPAKARFFMASIEMSAGDLAAARPLLEASASAEPNVMVFTMLAAIQRQSDKRAEALALVDRALAAQDARDEPFDVTDAHLLAFEIHREAGDAERAKASLSAALATVVAARGAASDVPSKLRAERLLAHVLRGFGDADGAARAMDRAMQLASGDRDAMSETVLDAVAQAFVAKDLPAARAALRRGIDSEVREEELVYGGLWVQFLEREKKAASDGTAEQALRRAASRGGWAGKLAAWANSRITEADLNNAAQSASQRIEAAFYTAMARRAAGDPAGETRLRDVAKSAVLDLFEVQLARELLAPRLRPEMPRNVAIP